MTDEMDRIRAWFTFADVLPGLREAPGQPWLRVSGDFDAPAEERDDSAAFVPTHYISEVLKDPSWDDHDHGPEVWSDGAGTRHDYYRVSKSGIEPLVVEQSFSGLRPPSYDLLEEFRLFHKLYFDADAHEYRLHDEAGDPVTVAKVLANWENVEVLTRAMRQFMAWKEAHLALYVVWHRFSEKTLAELGLPEMRRRINKDATSTFSLTQVPCNFREGYQSFARLVGKVLVPPLTREASNWGPFEDDRTYENFIIGVDGDGRPKEVSCAPEVSEEIFLKKVWFRADVLKRYCDEPSRYRVEDGLVACAGRWDLPIDNDHRDHVVAFLGDLRKLPEKEQRHWRVHNIEPAGELSETAFRRSFLAEWASSERPEHKFVRTYETFMKKSEEAGIQVIRPLITGDEHCLKTLHVPPTDEVLAFDQQVGSLTKLLVDSLNDAELAKHITVEKDDKSIRKLEKYLASKGKADFASHTGLLRDLQGYRSTNAAHRRGREAAKAFERLGGGRTSPRDVLASVFDRARALLEYLAPPQEPSGRDQKGDGPQDRQLS
jgi:hypothetical protein